VEVVAMGKRWRLGYLVVLGGLLGGGGPGGMRLASAQTQINPEATPTPPPPEELRRHIDKVRAETEQVKDVPVDDTGALITPAREVTAGWERALPPPEPSTDRPGTVPELHGKQRDALLKQPAYQERFAELSKCRNEVAFDRKVKPSKVTAKGVLLRWTVGIDGRPQDVEVVQAAPTDPDVMTCVHKKLSAWEFAPAPEDPYRISHRLDFD
jgi:hypothetical protein